MRYTTKRNGKNVIPLLNAVCGIDMPYWRIDRADDLHSYLSGDAADKLSAYEDMGLSPEEIKMNMDGLDEYHKAEAEGRLVILPCKVGDTLYAPTRGIVSEFVITKFEYEGIDSYGHGLWVCWNLANGITGELRLDGIDARYIGKRVFLTRAEAEAALEKDGDGE